MHAQHQAAKPRGGAGPLTLDDPHNVAQPLNVDLVLPDDALNELARMDERQSRIVDLRFFTALSIDETAEVMGISPATVSREWTTARAWLHRQMSGPESA